MGNRYPGISSLAHTYLWCVLLDLHLADCRWGPSHVTGLATGCIWSLFYGVLYLVYTEVRSIYYLVYIVSEVLYIHMHDAWVGFAVHGRLNCFVFVSKSQKSPNSLFFYFLFYFFPLCNMMPYSRSAACYVRCLVAWWKCFRFFMFNFVYILSFCGTDPPTPSRYSVLYIVLVCLSIWDGLD